MEPQQAYRKIANDDDYANKLLTIKKVHDEPKLAHQLSFDIFLS